jgi:hypothetical protein
MINTKDERTAELERWLAFTQRKHGEALDRAAIAERRADALERALRQTKARLERGWTDAAMRELDAARTNQPAQDGGRLDPYTLGRCKQTADQRAAAWQQANERRRVPSDYAQVSQWEAETISAAIRNLRPDQPAHHSLEPLQHKPLSEEARERGQEALRRLAGKNQPANRYGDKQCCQNCGAPIGDAAPVVMPFCSNECATAPVNQPADAGETPYCLECGGTRCCYECADQGGPGTTLLENQ